MTEPFFFSGRDNTPLFATWRAPSTPSATASCWVVCPPFAEEEKSAHRTLVELCEHLSSRGESSLFFAYAGTGDSGGDFAEQTLSSWREDTLSAIKEVARRTKSTPGLIGLRTGATLAAQVAREAGVRKLILIEPVLSGRSFLMQLGARKKLRAMITEEEGTSNLARPTSNVELKSEIEDYDGWPLSTAMQDELRALDLLREVSIFASNTEVLVLQVGPRAEISPQLQKWTNALKTKNHECEIESRAVVMPPVWNRLDLVSSSPLCEAVASFEFEASSTRQAAKYGSIDTSQTNERAVTFANDRGENLVAILHEPRSTIRNPQSTIVMLHGWTGYRPGPHQMLTRAARRFAAQGIAVFRFDFAGRGDSAGNAELATLATMTEDARAAVRWLKREQGSTHVSLLGLCSGCEVALATSAFEAENVENLLLWSAPVFAAQKSEERLARKRQGYLKEYARKLLRPATWAKVISGKADVRGVQKVLAQGGGQENKNVESGDPGQLPRGWRSGVLERWKKTGMPVFMVYGTSDPTTDEALKWHTELIAAREYSTTPDVHLVAGANHSYYGLEWEEEVFDVTQNWLLHKRLLPTKQNEM